MGLGLMREGMTEEESKQTMRHPGNQNSRARKGILAVVGVGILIALTFSSPTVARTTQEFVDSAAQHLAKGELQAALIELRNAERATPQDPIIHVRLAAIYLRLGNGADAEREAKAAGTLGAKEDDYLPLQMSSLLLQKKFVELLAQFPSSSRTPNLEAKVRQARADAYIGQHDYDHAIAALREATGIDPTSLSVKIALAQALFSTKAFDQADVVVEEVLATNSQMPAALRLKGEILQAHGDWEGAIAKLNETLEIAPNDVLAHLSRANLYLMHQDTASADKDLSPVLIANPNNPLANYLRALEFAQQKKFSEANDILVKMSPSFPNFVEGFYLQGAVQYSLGQMASAEDNLVKYIARVPDSASGLRLLAQIAMQRKAAPRAIGYLKMLLQKNPPDVATLSLLGNAYLMNGELELAQAQFDAAAKLASDNPEVGTRLALSEINVGRGAQGLAQLEGVYGSEAGATVAGPALVLVELRFGRVAKAAEVAQALVAKDSNNLIYLNLLGLARFGQGDYKAAEAAFSTIVAHEPGFAPATHNLVQLYIITGRRDMAEKADEALLVLKPDDIPTLLSRADLATLDQDWKVAIDYINRARLAAPGDPAPSIKLVDLYLRQRNYHDAQSTATELLTLFPERPDVLDAMVRTQIATSDTAGAVATYRRAFETVPTSAEIRGRYLSLLIKTKEFNTARDVLTKALSDQPRNVAFKGDLIRVEAEISGIDAGLAKAREFAAQDPKNPAYDLVAAELYEKAGRSSDAIGLLEKRGDDQSSETVMLALARLYLHAGEPDKALALLQKHLEKQPGDVDARLALAEYYLNGLQLDQARQQYERIITDAPASVIALNNVAWIYQQQGDIAKARVTAERAFALAPQNANSADTLGWIMVAQGDNAGALIYLKAANATSSDPNIGYHLAVALKDTGQLADAKVLLESILASGTPFQSKSDAQKLLQELTKG